ncbi:MAG: hypothetical protein MUO97_12630 [Dehalococcoidia bacterium]|nr:hypothetical protein [Dehalococcoidia bacterium]
MSPVIRIDDEVMEELKRHAIRLGLVFESPNATLRAILELDRNSNKVDDDVIGVNSKSIEVILNSVHSAREWALIPIPTDKRTFFPGYKVKFELETDVGTITTHITSDVKGTPIGDPRGGKYIQTGLREWFDNHPALKDGAQLRLEALEKGKRYKLSIISNS